MTRNKWIVLFTLVLGCFTIYDLIASNRYQKSVTNLWREKNSEHLSAPRIRVLYIVSSYSVREEKKINLMHSSFGDDLVLIWDNRNTSICPYMKVRCATNIPVTSTKEWSIAKNIGFGIEKAMMWAVLHTSEYDYVWTMESDIYFTDIEILNRVIYVNSSSDFMPQNEMINCNSQPWYHAERFMNKWEAAGFPRTCHHGLQNLFRLSVSLVIQLNDIRLIKLGGNWLFNEAMIPTAVRALNMSESLWKEECDLPDVSWTMRFRPCHVNITVPGIYHPVKFKNGAFAHCSIGEHYL